MSNDPGVSAARVEYVERFHPIPDDAYTRPGWLAVCPVHGELGDGHAYARERDAKAAATRHNRKVHADATR